MSYSQHSTWDLVNKKNVREIAVYVVISHSKYGKIYKVACLLPYILFDLKPEGLFLIARFLCAHGDIYHKGMNEERIPPVTSTAD